MNEKEKLSNFIKFVDDIGKQKPMTGILNYQVFKNGVLIEDVKGKNLILNGARDLMAHLIAGDVEDRSITKIAVGTNGTPPVVTNTAITGAFVKKLDGYSFPAMGQVQFNWSLGTHEANGMSIIEFGLMSADETLFSRRVREDVDGNPINKPINKESDISVIGQWIIIF